MHANVYNAQGEKVREIELPPHFEEEIRPDLIKRAVLAIYANRRQPYGASKDAGLEASAWTSKRRRSYRSCYGRGISRVPRAVLAGKGSMFYWVARVVPNAVKGRRAHPPKPEKIWSEKINKKERRKAIRSAIAATANEHFVLSRYSRASEFLKEVVSKFGLPIVLDASVEEISKSKQLRNVLTNLNLKDFLNYVKETKRVRAGKGKRRGRKYKQNRGLLIVISSEDVPLNKVGLEGVEIVPVRNLNAELLAPGCKPGRLTLWTEGAIERLNNLFI
jgi:large subunit ribosomal protein L4e